MKFKDSRLYELLRWVVAAGIGVSLLAVYFILLEPKIFNLADQPGYLELSNTSAQLEEKKNKLVFDARMEVFEQLGQEEQATIKALPYPEKMEKLEMLLSSDAVQIDEIISIDRQLMDINEKEAALIASLQKRKNASYYLLILFGLFLMMLSVFVAHSISQLLCAAIGSMFSLGAIGVLIFNRGLLYSFQSVLAAFLFASIAYVIWHFLSKKYVNAHRYLFLQIFGAFSLAYALCAFGSIVSERFSPSEAEELLKSYAMLDEVREPLLKEQKELLADGLLSKEQKSRYIELDHKLNAINVEWADKILALDAGQIMTRFFYQKSLPLSVLGVLYILLGTFFSLPVLISLGLILSGSFVFLFSLLFLYVPPFFSGKIVTLHLSWLILLSYGLFVAAMLAFTGYRLYHQRK